MLNAVKSNYLMWEAALRGKFETPQWYVIIFTKFLKK